MNLQVMTNEEITEMCDDCGIDHYTLFSPDDHRPLCKDCYDEELDVLADVLISRRSVGPI